MGQLRNQMDALGQALYKEAWIQENCFQPKLSGFIGREVHGGHPGIRFLRMPNEKYGSELVVGLPQKPTSTGNNHASV